MSILKSINEGFERRYGKLLDDRKQKEVKECDGECKDKKAGKEPIAKDYGARVAESCKKGVKECDEKNRKGAIVRRPAMKEACRKDRKSIKEYKDMGQDLGEYQKWVDYDMKRYHKISDKTMDKIKEAGLTVVKDQYGDYEVIAHEPVRECDDKEAKRRAIVKEAVERVRARKLQEAKQAEEKRKAVIKESVERLKARRLQESKKRK